MKDTIPMRVEKLSQVPKRLEFMYELDHAAYGYRLNPAGNQLARYRTALAESQGAQPPPPRAVKLSRHQWGTPARGRGARGKAVFSSDGSGSIKVGD